VRERLDAPDIPLALERLAARSFTPEQIFDVGAFHGEFARAALAVWPGAHIGCFEPIEKACHILREMMREQPTIELYAAAVGATEEPCVEMRAANASSTMLRDPHNGSYPRVEVPQTTIDATVRRVYAGRAPDLLKLDVQGYELEVLKGAEASLRDVRVILSELSLLDIHEGVPLLNEVLVWLSQRGFVPYDICGLTRRPLDRALWQTDMVFVRRDDALRSDKRYFAG
jgi:FkbM family methyltransferase